MRKPPCAAGRPRGCPGEVVDRSGVDQVHHPLALVERREQVRHQEVTRQHRDGLARAAGRVAELCSLCLDERREVRKVVEPAGRAEDWLVLGESG